MRIALVYLPPWKIPEPGAPPDLKEGPPPDYHEGDLDPDFHQTPYGLFSLAAQALRAGHSVKVLNLSGYTWSDTVKAVQALEADLFGMSCWTANRRGVRLVSELVRELHPQAHIVVGGPHATPLATELLEHYPAVDTVCLGESEPQFLTLIERLQTGGKTTGIPGTVYREDGKPCKGPPQPAIANLDELACPHDYFPTHIVMTSRGCPWQCTFCGAETTWGRGFRGQSIDYVLRSLESALERVPVRMIQIKDDTFTANKKRALELCRGIRERKLNFLWSCDTRVDVLTEELLREMRLAGCERLSLGVESGSESVLKAIHKKITAEKILEAGNLAKRFGIQVRFYMMLGNRGETRATFHETLEFLRRAKPHHYLFSCLSIYPGTLDFKAAEHAGWLDRNVYFQDNFQELKVPFDASPEDARYFSEWFDANKGLQRGYTESAADCRQILEHLGEHHAARLALAAALYREGALEPAQAQAERSLELGHPTPGLGLNLLAAIAVQRQDLESVQRHLKEALRTDPYHSVVARNAEVLRRWLVAAGPQKGLPLEFEVDHEFRLFERTQQPTLPGPLSTDFARWPTVSSNRITTTHSTHRHLRLVD